jgi:glutamate carboxypeptidase
MIEQIGTENFTRATAEQLLRYFNDRQAAFLQFTRRIVEIESPSGDVEGSSQVVAELANDALQSNADVKIERIESKNIGENLIIRAFNADNVASDNAPILLLGHTDTVHERGSVAARPVREDAGRLYAPGIFDMKINCALAIETLRACAALNLIPRRRIEILLTCDEEIGSYAGRPLVEEAAARAHTTLVLEPPAPGGRVKTARKGTGVWTIEARGRAAHAGLDPERGASAILELARQTERFHSMSDGQRGTHFNVGVISGGTRANVVAAEASAELDVRFSRMEDARQIEEMLSNLPPFDERVKIYAEGGINRPPFERTTEVVAVYEKACEVARTIDVELDETSVGGASDGNFAAIAGNGRILDGLGVDGDGAHSADEHILIDKIAMRGTILAGLLLTL